MSVDPYADVPPTGYSLIDERLAALRERFPGWRIWYVPVLHGSDVWCAQPLPLLNTHSEDDLVNEMREHDRLRSQTGGRDDLAPTT